MRITTTSKFAIAAALSLAIGAVPGSAAAQPKYPTYTPPAVSTPFQVNTPALRSLPDFQLHIPWATSLQAAREEEAKKQAILEDEEAKRVAEAREEAKKQAILEDEARKKKQAHLEQEERDRKIAEDKKRRLQGDPNRDWWCLVVICDPINRDDPGGFPRIVIDIRGPGPGPGPGPNPGNQDTETAELVRPCFAAGVIVSPADDQEDSDEEQVTDSSEVLCSGAAASSPLTKVESITPKTFASLWDEGGPFRKDPPNAVLAWGSGEDRKESKVILVGGQIDDGMSKYDIQYIGGDVPEFIMDKPKLTIAPVSCVQELTAFDTVILCN